MDVIQDSYVENANAHKNKEEKIKRTPQAAQESTKVTKKIFDARSFKRKCWNHWMIHTQYILQVKN